MLMKFRPQSSVRTSFLVNAAAPRSAPLAACLATALGLGSVSTPLLAVGTWAVQNCSDNSGAGSLRSIITTFAESGDTVDLSQLPVICGMVNSTITLTSGEIEVKQNDLTLKGPAGIGTVAISGNHASRVLNHTGTGTLSIDSLTIKDGAAAAFNSYGGCIRSGSNVTMNRSSVSGCVASGQGFVYGAGIYVVGALSLVSSTVSGNQANSGFRGLGGGIFAKNGFAAKYSTINLNYASTYGGGVFASTMGNTVLILNSSVNGNSSGSKGGGLFLKGTAIGNATNITNSTVSENFSHFYGGIGVTDSPVTVSNTTVAFNHVNYVGGGIGQCCSSAKLTLQSSIVADNTMGVASSPDDLKLTGGSTVMGANNLITSSNAILPADTLTSDPKLGPLRFNGGITKTHALLTDSPAIGKGNNSAGYGFDQRGNGYPRTTGASASVDIGAFQFDSIFADDFE